MRVDAECPKCGYKFEAVEWDSGCCPSCGKEYDWDEECYGDIDDPDSEYECYTFIRWE